MATTYEKIATTTLSSAAASIDFSSIPSTYTDLIISFVVNTTSTSATAVRMYYNLSTTAVYSYTKLIGDGSAASSQSSTSQALIVLANNATTSTTVPTFYQVNIFNYAGSTYKTALSVASADKNGTGATESTVSLWSNTTAINAIRLNVSGNTFGIGSTATLYGVKSA
jgi:hypothetical protein